MLKRKKISTTKENFEKRKLEPQIKNGKLNIKKEKKTIQQQKEKKKRKKTLWQKKKNIFIKMQQRENYFQKNKSIEKVHLKLLKERKNRYIFDKKKKSKRRIVKL